MKINYPPNIEIEVIETYNKLNLEFKLKHAISNFNWSDQSSMFSQEILTFNKAVTGSSFIQYNFTKNIKIVEQLLLLFNEYVITNLSYLPNTIEICSGTGILSIPLSKYTKLTCFENNLNYNESLLKYCSLFTKSKNTLQIEFGDLTNPNSIIKSTFVVDQLFDALIINPPYNLMNEALELIEHLKFRYAFAILPIYLLKECHPFPHNDESTKLVNSLSIVRERYDLIDLAAIYYIDGSCKSAIYVFENSHP